MGKQDSPLCYRPKQGFKNKLCKESLRSERSINWILNKAVEWYLNRVDQELKEIELKNKLKKST